MNRLAILICTIFLIILSNNSFADVPASSPYGNCILGTDVTKLGAESMTVAPFSLTCASNCDSACKATFSRLDANQNELNDDEILECTKACRKGSLYSGYYWENVEIDTVNHVFALRGRGPTTSAYACDASTGYNNTNIFNKSNTLFYKNHTVQFSIDATQAGNKVYMCGKKIINLKPSISSLKDADWNNTTAPPAAVSPKDQYKCTSAIPTTDWNNLSNSRLWNSADTFSSTGAMVSRNKAMTRPCDWNARIMGFTELGIYPKDGDELSLTWSGVFFSSQIPTVTSSKDLYEAYKNPASKGTTAAKVSAIMADMGKIDLLRDETAKMNSADPFYQIPYFDRLTFDNTGLLANNLEKATKVVVDGETFRTSAYGSLSSPSSSATPPAPNLLYGLTTSLLTPAMLTNMSTAAPNCDTAEKVIQNLSTCNTVIDPGPQMYIMKGILSGWSTLAKPLLVRHHGTPDYSFINMNPMFIFIPYNYYLKNNPTSPFMTNLGGFDFSATWGGCPREGGQGLQYLFSTTDPAANSTAWTDLDISYFSGVPFTVPNDGYLYLRFKPEPITNTYAGTLNPSITAPVYPVADYYLSPANRFGSYSVTLRGPDVANPKATIIRDIINPVRDTLFGTSTKTGVLENLYKALFKQSAVLGVIRAVLVLYVSITAIGFMIGTIQLHQQEVVKRIFKFAVVAALISPTSWQFMTTSFYNIFIYGGIELIAIVMSGGLIGVPTADLSADPVAIFDIFSEPFQAIFSSVVWFKVLALVMNSVLGIPCAIMIAISAIFYAFAMFKAIMMFLMSMIIISVMILISPIFFCFMLFNITRSMFDSWWKWLISFTLQPVAVFTAIGIFSTLILMTLKAALGFTACKYCAFAIPLPVGDPLCLWNSYRIVNYAHLPSGTSPTSMFYLPYATFQSSVLLLILCKGMLDFCSFLPQVIQLMITGSPMWATNLGQFGDTGLDKTLGIVNLDRRGRQQIGQKVTSMRRQAREDRELEKG